MTSPSKRRTKQPASPCSFTSRAVPRFLLTKSSSSTSARLRSRATWLHRRTPALAPQRHPLLLPRSPDPSPMGARHCAPLAQPANVVSSSHHRPSGKCWPLPSDWFSLCSLFWKLSREQDFRLFRPDATIHRASVSLLWRAYSYAHSFRSLPFSFFARFLAPFRCVLFRASSAGARSTPRANHFLRYLARHSFRRCSQGQCSSEPLG